ncbi:flagellar filament capping protein FliD [Desulfospira joergensenii]|uniref:flagellar filament capping protein FliD n=1 Tax=Desulfospira joergensenii TaxID=53329 RepID=UPI0003B686F8|nr:flagellar filament capping protein FliD [Desulfospira joergensenii]
MSTGSITSLGLGSSLDLQGMLDVQREADESINGLKLDEIEDQTAIKDQLNSVLNQLLSMKTTSLGLSLSSNYLYRSVTVSDSDIAKATAQDGTATGSYRVTTSRLATASSYISEGVSSSSASVYVPTVVESTQGFTGTDIVLAQGETMEVSYGLEDDPEVFIITGTAGGMTAADLVSAVNYSAANQDNGGNPLVTASTYTDKEGKTRIRIEAASGETGEGNRVSVSGSDIGFAAEVSELSFKLGEDGEVYTISVPAETTLEGLVKRISEDEDNPGVTATIIDTGTGDNPYQMVLTSKDTGEDSRIIMVSEPPGLDLKEKEGKGYTMTGDDSISFDSPVTIDATNNAVVFQEDTGDGYGSELTATIEEGSYSSAEELARAVELALENESKLKGEGKDYKVYIDSDTGKMGIHEAGTLEGLSVNWGDTDSTAASVLGFSENMELTPADSSLNAEITVGGNSYQRQDNTSLTDIIEGVTLSLYSTGVTTISIGASTSSVEDQIKSLVETYNNLIAEIDENDDYNEDEGTWGTLARSSTAKTLKQSLKTLFSATADTGGSFTSLLDLGVEFNDDGSITLDENILSQRLSEDFEEVQTLLLGTDTVTGLADILNEKIGNYALSDGYIDTEIDVIAEKISRLKNSYTTQAERLEKKYEIMTAEYTALDSYLAQIESTRSYIEQMLSSDGGDD